MGLERHMDEHQGDSRSRRCENTGKVRHPSQNPGIKRRVLAYNEKLFLAEHEMAKGWVGLCTAIRTINCVRCPWPLEDSCPGENI